MAQTEYSHPLTHHARVRSVSEEGRLITDDSGLTLTTGVQANGWLAG